MTRTTDLKEVITRPNNYTWGLVRHIHHVGPYDVVEFHPWKVEGSKIQTGVPDTSCVHYSCYVSGKDICKSGYSLDHALAICMAHKFDGPNSQAADYFVKMIGCLD